jgi:hypothetical protein
MAKKRCIFYSLILLYLLNSTKTIKINKGFLFFRYNYYTWRERERAHLLAELKIISYEEKNYL